MFKKIFHRKKDIEVKSNPPATAAEIRQSLISCLLTQKKYDLAASVAIQYYSLCAPAGTGIDMIINNAATINPSLYDTKNKEYISDPPAALAGLQNLLEMPNSGTSWNEFIQKYAGFLEITGNNYMIANFIDLNREPNQLFIAHPQTVSVSTSDGKIDHYTVTMSGGSVEYKRTIVNRRNLFVATLNNGVKSVLLHSMLFNPRESNYEKVGKSPLAKVYYEIEQFIAAGVHNLSTLKRGARTSGFFNYDGQLTESQREQLTQAISNSYSGEDNAGRPFLAEGKLSFEESQQSNKDMDFLQGKKDNEQLIYKALKVPVALINPASMTMANLAAAKLDLYDNAITPLIDRIFDDLTIFLMPFYKNSEDVIISYDKNLIAALEPRRMQTIKDLVSLGVLTINEVRALLNYEDYDGGDLIYAPSSEIPIELDVEGRKAISRQAFKKSVQKNYGQLFSEQEIIEITNEAYDQSIKEHE